jgi:hypothetical protein
VNGFEIWHINRLKIVSHYNGAGVIFRDHYRQIIIPVSGSTPARIQFTFFSI